jgi:hypothetical protein
MAQKAASTEQRLAVATVFEVAFVIEVTRGLIRIGWRVRYELKDLAKETSKPWAALYGGAFARKRPVRGKRPLSHEAPFF